jgi:hypothetical protein
VGLGGPWHAEMAYSVIDRSATDARVQIEIPVKCDAIRGLLRAVDKGLKVRGPASRPVVTHDRTYHVPDRRPLPGRRDWYEVMEVAPRRREDRRRAEGGGRRREEDEKERRQRRKKLGEPVIVYAEPRGKTYLLSWGQSVCMSEVSRQGGRGVKARWARCQGRVILEPLQLIRIKELIRCCHQQ